MIRALYEKLDIPPALLVREPSGKYEIEADFDEADIPLDLLQQRGWIEAGITAKQILHRLLAPETSPVLAGIHGSSVAARVPIMFAFSFGWRASGRLPTCATT